MTTVAEKTAVKEEEMDDMIASLKNNKDNLRFRHMYVKNEDGTKRPIATVASVLDRDKEIMFAAMSRCLPEDTFSKEFGRHVAEQRLDKTDDYVVAQSSRGEEWSYALYSLISGDPVAVAKEDWFDLLDDARDLVQSDEDRREFLNKVRANITIA